jgi:ABC-type polysaccharide/polyol phosphate transport system ATPase subunit
MEVIAADRENAGKAAVEVHQLSKNYSLSNSQLGRLRHLFGGHKHGPDGGLWALRDVSFSVARGEAFGIIGTNGSGKSTLLQIIAGILRPTSGSAQVSGRLSALLELGAGFSPEFSGRDNVYLNGSLLGLSREEIDSHFAAIEHFAGIGNFIEQPIKTYSTGMVLRLAFAVAAHVDPEVLIVDEALAVGDIAFRQRCMRKIHELRGRGATILFVSHESSDLKALCERCLWLQNGVVQELGEADEVVAKYLSATFHREAQHVPVTVEAAAGEVSDEPPAMLVADFKRNPGGHRYGDRRASIVGGRLLDSSHRRVEAVTLLEAVTLRFSFRVDAEIAAPIAGFLVRNHRGENIFGSNTARENFPLPSMRAGAANNVDFHWTVPALTAGTYQISLGIADGSLEDFRMCDYIEDAIEMKVMAMGELNAKMDSGTDQAYFQLRCAAVTVHRNVAACIVVNKGGSVV